jgi:hypothetical protein
MPSSIEGDSCMGALWDRAPSNAGFYAVCTSSDGSNRGAYYNTRPEILDEFDDEMIYVYSDQGRCSPVTVTSLDPGIYRRRRPDGSMRIEPGVNTYAECYS